MTRPCSSCSGTKVMERRSIGMLALRRAYARMYGFDEKDRLKHTSILSGAVIDTFVVPSCPLGFPFSALRRPTDRLHHLIGPLLANLPPKGFAAMGLGGVV